MVKIVLGSYVYTKSYLILKSKNVVKFYVHIRPIFSCRVTNVLCTKILPIMLALCLMLLPSYNSYYAQNYAGIIGSSLGHSGIVVS